MTPQFTTGVLNQKLWRLAVPAHDCAVMAAIAGVHAVAPWVSLPSSRTFREKAGNTTTGLTLDQTVKAIKAIWPEIGAMLTTSAGTGSWATFLAAVKSGRCAAVHVYSSSMATSGGVTIRHSVNVYWTGTALRVVNPLRAPYTYGTAISEVDLKAAMDAMPEPGLWYYLFPTVADALVTHPLYP